MTGEPVEQPCSTRSASTPEWPASTVGLVYVLSDRKFAGPINGYEQLQPALGGLDLGDVHVEDPDWIALETLPLWCVTFDVRQAR